MFESFPSLNFVELRIFSGTASPSQFYPHLPRIFCLTISSECPTMQTGWWIQLSSLSYMASSVRTSNLDFNTQVFGADWLSCWLWFCRLLYCRNPYPSNQDHHRSTARWVIFCFLIVLLILPDIPSVPLGTNCSTVFIEVTLCCSLSVPLASDLTPKSGTSDSHWEQLFLVSQSTTIKLDRD